LLLLDGVGDLVSRFKGLEEQYGPDRCICPTCAIRDVRDAPRIHGELLKLGMGVG